MNKMIEKYEAFVWFERDIKPYVKGLIEERKKSLREYVRLPWRTSQRVTKKKKRLEQTDVKAARERVWLEGKS